MKSCSYIAIIWLVLAVAVPWGYGQAPLPSFNRITTAEIQILLKGLVVSNPNALRGFETDPDSRKQQLDNLRQLLAFASQAQKVGLANEGAARQELENIRSEIVATSYDKEATKNKKRMPPFGYITEDQIGLFWRAPRTAKAREDEFQRFLDSKQEIMKAGNPQMKDTAISEEERLQARDFFAKIEISEAAYEAKKATFPKELRDRFDLQVKLQQAQFLARLYSEKAASRMMVSGEEIDTYIAGHPELDTSQKKAKAEKILVRVKAGEDFAALANEFTEDPGNTAAGGKLAGGLYANVPVGQMVPPFEQAALRLKPGEVAPEVVQTEFGYHIIKLEKKGKNPSDPGSEIYDVRHILITTMYTDPANAAAGGVPIVRYVRSRLEAEKERQLLDELVEANNIQVPDDFVVPKLGPTVGTVKRSRPASRKRSIRKRR